MDGLTRLNLGGESCFNGEITYAVLCPLLIGLSQSSCGYHPQARQDRENKKTAPTTEKVWSRRAPFDFTGCIAHVEIVERTRDGEITRVIGIFEHNTMCRDAILKRLPAVPLHEHVYEVALEQMDDGAK